MFNTPDLCDEFSSEISALPPIFRSFGGKTSFSGKVVTVKCFEDNSRVKELANTNGEGCVMVVDGGASLNAALIGDLIAASAIENGWQGIIINGCCRDVHELQTMPFGVFALASFPIKSNRQGLGEIDVDLEFGACKVSSGMWVYADETGVIVSKKELV
jgi:regulator of ribonuclease activity A